MFDKTYGIVNYALAWTGLVDKPIDWLLNPTAALFAVCLTTIWKGYPFFTIMLLAALQAIPADLYDAARVDGASTWDEFRTITLPAIRSVTAIVLLIQSLWVFREFTVIFILTGGGPAGATRTLAIWTYTEAFGNFNMGFAAAIGVLTLLVSVIASVVFVRMSRSEFYGFTPVSASAALGENNGGWFTARSSYQKDSVLYAGGAYVWRPLLSFLLDD
jgi:multiple sugar transport system permease protein